VFTILVALSGCLLLSVGMSEKASAQVFKKLADRAGMCPASALLDPEESGGEAFHAAENGSASESAPRSARQPAGQAWELPKRQLWECVCRGPSVGGQSLLECLLRAPWRTGAYHALVDTACALDPETLHDGLSERLLWVPVRGPEQTVRALDLLLRDDNFALVAADLRGLSPQELERIQPFAWYRLQRLAHQRAGGAVLLSEAPSVRCADRRILLARPRCLEDLDRSREALLDHLETTTRHYPRGQLSRGEVAELAG
jgi:hypothetical protein